MQRQLRVIFVTLTNDLGTDRIVSHMGAKGADCAVVGRPGSFAALSRFCRRHVMLPSVGGTWAAALALPRRLEALAAHAAPDLLVPLDDMAAHVVRTLYRSPRTSPRLRALVRFSLGSPDAYGIVGSREHLIAFAAARGIRTPAQTRVPDLAAALQAARVLGYPVVLKREGTCGGSGVAVSGDAENLERAFRNAERKARAKRAVQNVLGFSGAETPALTLQSFVSGALAMRTAACAEGRVLEAASFMAEQLHPATVGSSTVVRPVDNREMNDTVDRLVSDLGCSGLVSFDFILAENGEASLIEMNPRAVGSGHLGAMFGHDVYGALLAHRQGRPVSASVGTARVRSIALFPKELERDPQSSCFARTSAVFHDVPWDEPRVIEAYLRRLREKHPAHAGEVSRMLSPAPGREAAALSYDPASLPGAAHRASSDGRGTLRQLTG